MPLSTRELPPNHRAVLAVVSEYGAGRHATAKDVYQRVRELRPGIGFATVHRALARLHELGHILKLELPGSDAAIYEPAIAPHAHFRCTACGAVADVDYACEPATLAALERRHGVAIRGEAMTFSGLCANCR
jgi:Fe2+ or Zn2+ uptake regulation protein